MVRVKCYSSRRLEGEALVLEDVLPILPVGEYVARAHLHHQLRPALGFAADAIRGAAARGAERASRERKAGVHRRGEREQPLGCRAVGGRLLGQLTPPPETRGRGETAAARVVLFAPRCHRRRREQAAEVEAAGAGVGKPVEARWEECDALAAHGTAQHPLDHQVSVACLSAVIQVVSHRWDMGGGEGSQECRTSALPHFFSRDTCRASAEKSTLRRQSVNF